MNTQEKIEWLEKASAEELLRQYERSARDYENIFDAVERMKRTFEVIEEDYRLARAEVLKRLAR